MKEMNNTPRSYKDKPCINFLLICFSGPLYAKYQKKRGTGAWTIDHEMETTEINGG